MIVLNHGLLGVNQQAEASEINAGLHVFCTGHLISLLRYHAGSFFVFFAKVKSADPISVGAGESKLGGNCGNITI